MKCENCLRKEQCDVYIERDGRPNLNQPCMVKTFLDVEGNLDNNTRRYLAHEKLDWEVE